MLACAHDHEQQGRVAGLGPGQHGHDDVDHSFQFFMVPVLGVATGAENVPATVALRVQLLTKEGVRHTVRGEVRYTERVRADETEDFAEEYLLSAYAMHYGFGPKIYLAGRFRE